MVRTLRLILPWLALARSATAFAPAARRGSGRGCCLPTATTTSAVPTTTTTTKASRPRSRSRSGRTTTRFLGSDAAAEAEVLETIRSMRVAELKGELESRGVSTGDAFEKEELVRRLFLARMEGGADAPVDGGGGVSGEKRRKKKKKRRTYDEDEDELRGSNGVAAEVDTSTGSDHGSFGSTSTDNGASFATPNDGSWTVRTPFVYYDLAPSQSVAASNRDDVFIRPSRGRFAAIEVFLRKGDAAANPVKLTLLVDTACSGLVLSPGAVARANRECPGLIQSSDAGATMTMAGSSQGTSVARWDSHTKMVVGGVEVDRGGVAACQDIGALPPGLDGILGLSFLGRYACADFDFANDELRLHASESDPIVPQSGDVVAQGPMRMTRLGIYYSEVTLDGRGPVRMLADTGAASSFLNWKGVADMRLTASSPQIEPIRDRGYGAMGADNVALQLTHRFALKRRWNLVAENNAVGDFCPGVALKDDERGEIDVSDLPVLQTLEGDGVGGILGAELLMMCDVVRFRGLNGRSPSMVLMKQCRLHW